MANQLAGLQLYIVLKKVQLQLLYLCSTLAVFT